VLLDCFQKARRQLGLIFGAFEQCFDEALDQRKRGAQFVADVGDKFLAGILQLFNTG